MTSLRTTLLLFGFYILNLSGFSQNVTILPGGITPIQSSTYARLSYDAIVAITSPQDGDIVYDTTFKCMRLYNGTKWVRLISEDDLNIPSLTGWSAGGTEADEGLSITTDTSGNIYVTGYFGATAVFGDTSVVSAGNLDIFLAKYTNTGILKWVNTAGGINNDISRDIVIDNDGNLFITGGFQATISFGTTSLASNGDGDIFIAKYNNNGILEWVRHGGGIGDETANGIAIDINNNVYITGYFLNTAFFGLSSINSVGAADIFIAKYTSNGTLDWLKREGSVYTDVANSISVDQSGYVYITGYFHIGTSIGVHTPSSAGGTDIFIAKYDPVTSYWIWAQKAGGTTNDGGNSIVTDNAGNVYITGYFANTATFGNTSITGTGIHWDIFLAKYDTNGILQWVTKAGGVNEDVGKGITIDNSGNTYITGYFAETALFGNTSIVSNGNADLFIAKFNNAGVLQWVQKAGNILGDTGSSLTVDRYNNVYMTGYFQNVIQIGNIKLTNNGGGDIFVARIRE